MYSTPTGALGLALAWVSFWCHRSLVAKAWTDARWSTAVLSYLAVLGRWTAESGCLALDGVVGLPLFSPRESEMLVELVGVKVGFQVVLDTLCAVSVSPPVLYPYFQLPATLPVCLLGSRSQQWTQLSEQFPLPRLWSSGLCRGYAGPD